MEMQQQKLRKEAGGSQQQAVRRHGNVRKNMPYVEYTRQVDPTGEDEQVRNRMEIMHSICRSTNTYISKFY